MTQTAIVVPLPEADAQLRPFRLAHTQSGPRGVPAHVTLLFPFADTAVLSDEHTRRVAELVAAVPAFDVRLGEVGYLPGAPRVLYLRPEPDEPFRELTLALAAAFPEHPPYEGAYDDPVPHATVAIAPEDVLVEVERAVVPLLPLRASVRRATLIALDEATDRWTVRERFPFSG